MRLKKLGITMGDPAGVGPELILKLYPSFRKDTAYIIYAERKTLQEAKRLTGIDMRWEEIQDAGEVKEPGVYLVDLSLLKTAVPEPSPASGRASVAYLGRGVADALRGNIGGILTMPINKFWAKKAGFDFPGQTEYLARASGRAEYAMMLYSRKLKVVLQTTHVPLSEVPKLINREAVLSKIKLINREFKRLFGFYPRIKVLGLNPHAGEGGQMGKEELLYINPAVEEARALGIDAVGALSPDTAFLGAKEGDVFLCMYHDQGLVPFKLLAFEEGVNLTLGLPFVRTSPDHGTAYDIAWKNVASPSSALSALSLLEKLL
ncbi:MAG: 4-hydroxythreonine-4-phosphate dehydrogenase PdxA [Aquificae bacterium]|nr:4-hydroxythreonine-4-phosphate dehydrogenase PdxA [Aquificota bacterium]